MARRPAGINDKSVAAGMFGWPRRNVPEEHPGLTKLAV